MIVGGVDLGVRKAAISLRSDGDLSCVEHFEVPRQHRHQELRILAEWCYGYLKVADAIFIEEPLVGRNTRVSLQIAQTAGAVMSSLGSGLREVHIDFVDNKSWKKAVIGNGNANKEDITSWLKSHHPSYAELCGGNQDRVDATCIGIYGGQLCERATQLADL